MPLFLFWTCHLQGNQTDYWSLHQASQSQLGLIAYVRGCSQTQEGSLERLGRPSEDLYATLWHTSTWTSFETRATAEAFSSMLTEHHKKVKLRESLQISKESTNEAELPISQSITHWIKMRAIKKLSPKHGFSLEKNSENMHKILLLLLLVLAKL